MKTKLFALALAATSGISMLSETSVKHVQNSPETASGMALSSSREYHSLEMGFSYFNVLTPVLSNISNNRLPTYSLKKNDPTKGKGMSAYPNPANDEVNIDLTLLDKSDITFRMMDLTGKDILVKFVKEVGNGNHIFTIQTKAFEAGHYVVTATKQNNQPIGTIKLVIRH